MNHLIGLGYGLLATAAWGSFYIAGRWLFGESGNALNSWLFNFHRFGVAVLALSLLLLKPDNRKKFLAAVRDDWKTFLVISLVGIDMESILVFSSLNFTTAARCSLMANCSPIAIVILAYLLLKQKTSPAGLAGMGIGFAGIVLATLAPGGDVYADTSWRTLLGDGMALGSGVCWAVFTVCGAEVSRKYGGQVCMFTSFLFGFLLMIPVLPLTVSAADWRAVDGRQWAGIFYTGVVTLALANVWWYAALRHLKPGVLGAFGYLSAAITFTLSLFVLKERFTFLFVLAIALILGGMALMVKKPKRS